MTEIPKLLEFKYVNPDELKQLQDLVYKKVLPPDVLFRAMHIGAYEPASSSSEKRQGMYWNTIANAIQHTSNPSDAQPLTQELIFNSVLPDTVIDTETWRTKELYQHLTSLYWSRGALGKIILQRRAAEGVALTDSRNEFHWTWETEWLEKNRCKGLAQGVWRALIRRLRPDILEHPRWFYPDTHISMNGTRELSERTIRRNAIACTKIKDETMRELYDEMITTGMKGIGSVGRRDIAAMLASEHPDIMLQLASEEGLAVELCDKQD